MRSGHRHAEEPRALGPPGYPPPGAGFRPGGACLQEAGGGLRGLQVLQLQRDGGVQQLDDHLREGARGEEGRAMNTSLRTENTGLRPENTGLRPENTGLRPEEAMGTVVTSSSPTTTCAGGHRCSGAWWGCITLGLDDPLQETSPSLYTGGEG